MRNTTNADFEIKKVEPYLHKGCLVICETSFECETWNEFIIAVVRYGQKFGYGWSVSEKIEDVLSISTTQFHSGAGINLAEIRVERSEFEANKIRR